jgi:hypothetical protein
MDECENRRGHNLARMKGGREQRWGVVAGDSKGRPLIIMAKLFVGN